MAQGVTVTQTTAEDFVSSLGVNTKAGTYSDAYTNASLVINSLDYLGISTVRDSYSEYGQANPVLDALANAGIQFDFRVSYSLPATGSAGLSDYIDALKAFVAEHPGSVIAVEGINEANANSFSYNGDSSVAGAAAFQRDLYLAIRAEPELSSVLVYNLSIAYNDPSVFAAVGDLGAYSDAANAHAYPNTGKGADAQVESIIALARSNSQGDPLVVTETGYTTLESASGVGVNEDAQAKLVLQNLLAAYEDGSTKTYLYTLFDEPSVAATRGDKEVSFGLFNADGSPKEAAVAIHNLTTILNFGNDGSASTATDTAFTLSGATSDTHSMIMTKSGGVYDIVLWQNVTVWNDVTDTEIVNSTTPVTVDLGETVSSVRIYDPLGGLDPIATYTNVSSFTVPLSDHPLVIEIGASEAVHEDVVTSAANLTLTSAEFVAQIDTLATATGLQSVTLSDSHELAVASVETMQYIIANYGSLLSKIDGGYTFSVTYGQSTWRKEQIFDANGNLQTRIDYGVSNDVVVSKVAYNNDGSVDYYNYNITGQTYTSQHLTVNAAGVTVLTERFHADGTRDYVQTVAADGTKDTVTYNSAGQKTSDINVATDGTRTTLTYDPSSGYLTQSLLQAASGVVTTKTYTAGVLMRTTVANTDGSVDYYNYNITGQTYTSQHQTVNAAGVTVLTERFHADGTLDYVQTVAADGTKDTVTYNSAGQKTTDISLATDGSLTTLTYDPSSGYLTQSLLQAASG
ncbi:RHS repeat domain-containing protein, partial [Xanthobacter versatilis]